MGSPGGCTHPDAAVAAALDAFNLRLARAGMVDLDAFCAEQPASIREAVRRSCHAALDVQRTLQVAAELGRDRFRPGQVIGDYRLLEKRGEGAMGVVYRARQLSLDREVALKVLALNPGVTARVVERFRGEALKAGKLAHPGIVRVYAVGEGNGALFIAMEYLRGRSLAERLHDPPGDEPPARVRWTGDASLVARVGEALDHAHGQGIIHRDIKPSNIVLDEDGQPFVVDFGLARDLSEPSTTRPGELAGTPFYMSPEQVLAQRVTIDHRTDVYSLGVVMYELLTRHRPFDAPSQEQLLYDISFTEPRPPRRIDPRIPKDLETICLKAIEKDPARRFATAGELAVQLRAYLDGDPLDIRPPSWLRRTVTALRRRPRRTRAAAALLLAAVSAWAGLGLAEHREQPRLTVRGPAGARVRLLTLDPATGRVLGERDLGELPVTGGTVAPGLGRIVVERPGVGQAEFTRMLARGAPDVVLDGIRVRPFEEVTAGMREIPAGSFWFGEGDEDSSAPYHRRRAELPAFLVDETEVSNAEYRAFVEATGRDPPPLWPDPWDDALDELPVVCVSLADARAYAEWRGKRLPTVMEWERAARGTDGRLRPRPEEDVEPEAYVLAGPVPGYAYDGDADVMWARQRALYLERVEPVRSRAGTTSPENLYHVLGNAREWTESPAFVIGPDGRARPDPSHHVTKGGGWTQAPRDRTLVHNDRTPIDVKDRAIGFRCAVSAPRR